MIFVLWLNEVNPDTHAKISNFVENYFKGNIILATQPLEWTPPATINTFVLQLLKPDQIKVFLKSRYQILKNPQIRAEEYEAACRTYLSETMNERQSEDLYDSNHIILSNPLDLTIMAQMLANGEKPDLFNLQKQQYNMMAQEYKRIHIRKEFPLSEFSELVYKMRINNNVQIPSDDFIEAVKCMERYKMVLCRKVKNTAEKTITSYYFRHDKIMEYFIAQTFLGENNKRISKHLCDPLFRGVYFLLADFLPLKEAKILREQLILNAAKTKDHRISDNFIQRLHSREVFEFT